MPLGFSLIIQRCLLRPLLLPRVLPLRPALCSCPYTSILGAPCARSPQKVAPPRPLGTPTLPASMETAAPPVSRAVTLLVAGHPASSVPFSLTPQEEGLFSVLRAAGAAGSPSTVIRVAGGWVRDKLLGRQSHDIDIVLDNVSGCTFAEHVRRYMLAAGMSVSDIGVITARPDQSKHLETATMRMMDMSIDFVNMRAEEYDVDSRIPHAVFGTPLQVRGLHWRAAHLRMGWLRPRAGAYRACPCSPLRVRPLSPLPLYGRCRPSHQCHSPPSSPAGRPAP